MSTSDTTVLVTLTGTFSPTDIWDRLYPLAEVMARIALCLRKSGPLCFDDEDRVVEGAYAALENVCRYRGGFQGVTEGEARAWLWKVTRHATFRVAGRYSRRRRLEIVTDPDTIGRIMERDRYAAEEVCVSDEAMGLLERAIRKVLGSWESGAMPYLPVGRSSPGES